MSMPVLLDDYVAIGSNWEACTATEQEVIVTGQSGSGKTRALLEKVHRACKEFTNIKVLLLRKRSADLAGSALELFRDHVAGPALHTGEVRFFDASRSEPARYEYRNSGSMIVLGGLWPPTQATKVTNSEWDIVCVIAANELTEHDWELLIPLCRNGSLPINQLIGECQPQGDDHWILQRAKRGQLRLIEGVIEDNPRWFRNGEITREGRAFIAKLDALTGVTKLRNRYGYWVAAQGQCWPSYNDKVHLIEPFPFPFHWPTWWSIDFGKVHPFAFGLFTMDPNGRAFLVKQIHMSGRETEEHCRDILRITQPYASPTDIITDHAANDVAICERMFGRKVVLANKSVLEGIDYVEKRWAQRKLFIFDDSLVEIDETLRSRGRPIDLQSEIPGYVWQSGKRSKEGPVKAWDDSCDMTRYFIAEQDAPEQWEVSW